MQSNTMKFQSKEHLAGYLYTRIARGLTGHDRLVATVYAARAAEELWAKHAE